MATKPEHPVLPIFSLLLAATFWGVLWYPLRLLEQHGLQGLWATLVSYGAALVVGVPALVARRRALRAHALRLVALALAAGWCNVAFILSVIEGNVVRVMLLFYLSPVWTVLLGRILLGERLSPRGRWVFVLALIGAATMLWDPSVGLPLPRNGAEWLALSAGVGFAANNVVARSLTGASILDKTLVTWLGVVLVAVLGLTASGGGWPQAGPIAWGGAVLLGWLGVGTITVALLYGVSHMPVHRSAIILLFELVAGAVSSQLLTTELVTVREWLGGGLIVAAAVVAARMQTEE